MPSIQEIICLASTELDKTLYEIIFGERPNRSRLRIFGCKVYVPAHEMRQKGKFEKSAEERIMVENGKGKSYRILVFSSRLVIESQDIILKMVLSKMICFAKIKVPFLNLS